VKRNLLAVSAINTVHIPDESSMLLIVHEDIYSDTANHSLLSGFELSDLGAKTVSICHRNGGTQQIVIQGDGDSLVNLLEFADCTIHFEHQSTTTEDINSLKHY
jgi:hypothetical protein